jgi:hypothetical protein
MTDRQFRPEDRGVQHSNLRTGAFDEDKPISDLRRRMIADMTIRTFSDKTQHDYIRHVERSFELLAAKVCSLPSCLPCHILGNDVSSG